MSETATLSFPAAARSLGVSVRVLRSAIRAGKLPAPPQMGATAALPDSWLASAQSAVATSPHLFASVVHQKVPPFARYVGTSAWRKYRVRVRAYARHQAAHAGEPAVTSA